ncbi:DUF805 domain-containing protein [Levilactobacillus yiduensis]|uniref:DUF805 domain-containing protein n=1 Tax=Levilactobacillus yiduensis TaxID=2953880 RepID=UPI000EF2F267|nr:DUF805 domain-containing protein [Levilactobacillus yiduensis]AYM01558.1 DUF805 domain-containing protein [Levilactobacillus brevis]
MRELKIFCRHSLSGHGTASRREFWWAVVMVYAIGLAMIVGLALAQSYGWQAIVTVQLPTLRLTDRLILMVAWALLLSVKVRRLHDLRLSGWWVVLNAIPVLGALAMTVAGCWPSRAPQIRAVK